MPSIPKWKYVEPGWVNFDEGSSNGDHDDSSVGNWSSFIGIITAIVGNILIALALNVQRYSHIQLHRRRVEARERAKEALRRVTKARGYGTTDSPQASDEDGPVGSEAQNQPPDLHCEDTASSDSEEQDQVASTYLKSPLWWLGQVLMTFGEMGNFLAYGFAPASIVSPLGVVALVSNCVIAPMFFHESFRTRDFWGVVIAVAGVVTVVWSAKQQETKLDPHDVWEAITTMEFEIYMAVSISLIIILMWASPRYGNRTILIDLGLVGLFGAYTALSTKGVSSMLSSTLFAALATPVTYVLVVILLGTAVMQVRYVNKALQRFDSTQVIPIQFVLFTFSVIIGSAVLYRDFERTTAEQAVKFFGGCLLTFFGVFLITSGRPPSEMEDELSDEEGVEETIGLRDHEHTGPVAKTPHDGEAQHPAEAQEPSRRSSRVSRVSFASTGTLRPLTVQRDSGVPSTRNPSTPQSSLPAESSPLMNNPWRETEGQVRPSPQHPGLLPTFSDDSVVTIDSVPSINAGLPPPIIAPPSPNPRPSASRTSLSSSRPHSHHFSNNIFSPSPLSSTVSAVVADKLLRGEESPLARRKSVRRLRPSIRSSLYVPQSEDEDDEQHEADALLPEHEEEEDVESQPRTKTLRGRARSVSNTLGELFSRKKRRRRNSNPEDGHESQGDETARGQ